MDSIDNLAKATLERLERFGVFQWHKATTGSVYLKFKDVRLGSIRIANHKGRSRYSYTFEYLFGSGDGFEKWLSYVERTVDAKSRLIAGWDSKAYVVFDKNSRSYHVVDRDEYKKSIYHKVDKVSGYEWNMRNGD